MSLEIRRARPGDALALLLRPEDAAELALYRPGAFRRTLGSPGESWAASSGGQLVALWGGARSAHGLHPWMMASSAIRDHRRTVATEARALVAMLREQRRPVWNLIGKASASNRRFVAALGFSIVPLREGPFDRFELRP